jgi:glycosyltransferase involved in cell wall biosynthesis
MSKIKLLSIVLPYFNKRQLLMNTLQSIAHFKKNYPIEVVIVDDASTQKINDVKTLFPGLNITLITVGRNPVTWRGPVVAYNIGFNAAKGDVIMINGTDCFHMGDIIGYVFENFKPNSYLSFSAYRGLSLPDGLLDNVKWENNAILKGVYSHFDVKNKDNWHVHSQFLNYLIPFVAVLWRSDMEALSGMDERFETGIGFDDNDFIDRIRNLGLEMILLDEPFCVHQKHPPTVYSNDINFRLYTKLRRTEPNRVKAATNKMYRR